jgi:hypothetical protein
MQASTITTALALLLFAGPAAAEIRVRFTEGALKDQFEITNIGTCALKQTAVTIDLSGSAAGLIFDVTGAGAGVQVFQPFQLVKGADALSGLPTISDGDTRVSLAIRSLAPGAQIVFTIDVDDTLDQRGIIVAGSEIEGTIVQLASKGTTASGRFTRQAEAIVKTPPCV